VRSTSLPEIYSPERENRAFTQLLVDVDDWRKIEGLIAVVQKHLDERYPDANAVAKKVLAAVGMTASFAVRTSGVSVDNVREDFTAFAINLNRDQRRRESTSASNGGLPTRNTNNS